MRGDGNRRMFASFEGPKGGRREGTAPRSEAEAHETYWNFTMAEAGWEVASLLLPSVPIAPPQTPALTLFPPILFSGINHRTSA